MKTNFTPKRIHPYSAKEVEKGSTPSSFKQRNALPQVYNLPAMYIKERLSAVSVSWHRRFFSQGMVNTKPKQEESSPETPVDFMSSHDATFVTEAISYRTPLPVTHVIELSQGDFYPVCPRCDVSMEREYMAYCDRCGQRLSWGVFDKAEWLLSGHKTD